VLPTDSLISRCPAEVRPAFLSGVRREAEEEAVYARLATEVPGDVLVSKYFEEIDRA
jgi:hypothetical protein